MRCENGELTYGPAVSVGHRFSRSMRTEVGYSCKREEQPHIFRLSLSSSR